MQDRGFERWSLHLWNGEGCDRGSWVCRYLLRWLSNNSTDDGLFVRSEFSGFREYRRTQRSKDEQLYGRANAEWLRLGLCVT